MRERGRERVSERERERESEGVRKREREGWNVKYFGRNALNEQTDKKTKTDGDLTHAVTQTLFRVRLKDKESGEKSVRKTHP